MTARITLLIAVTGLFASGCGQSPPAVAQSETPRTLVVVEPTAEEPKSVPPVPPVQPGQARPLAEFAYPDDTGGKKVAATLAPSLPPAPVVAPTTKPKGRSSEIDRGELPLPKVTTTIPATPLPKAKSPRPSPPAERVPPDVGSAAALDPSQEKLPERPGVKAPVVANPGAVDVPRLAILLPDRASLEDPTTEIAAARAVFTMLPLPFNPVWFVRFGIPDPFEFAEHLRGKTGAAGELGTTPVNVPPMR